MTENCQQSTWKRYIGDNCKPHPEVEAFLKPFKSALHQAFAHWLSRGYYRRDISQAVRHCASLTFIEHAFQGHPRLTGEPLSFPDLGYPEYVAQRKSGTRLYDEIHQLAPEVKLDQLQQLVNIGFVQWVAEGWHPRDFLEAAADCAQVLVYDLEICESLGGLGGCKDAESFLTQPYKG